MCGTIEKVRDKNQFMFFARQVYPENSASLYKAYLDATQRPHGYLLLELSQDTDDRLRFQICIFSTEQTIVYSPISDEASEIELSRLSVLKTADPKLRKAIISNCNKDTLNGISKCIINVFNRNVKLTSCNKRKVRKHKARLRKLTDKRVPLSTKKKLIVQRGGFLLPLLSAVVPSVARLIVSSK